MQDFSDIDLALLGHLVPAAERLAKRSIAAYTTWLEQLTPRDRSLLVRWYAAQTDDELDMPDVEVAEPANS